MGGFGDDLVRDAREALAIAKGEMKPAQVYMAEGKGLRTAHAAREVLASRVEVLEIPGPLDATEPAHPVEPPTPRALASSED